jgi:hypothetical protein
MKIRTVGAGVLHVDGQMDRHDEATSHIFVILRECIKSLSSGYSLAVVRN